MRKHMKKIEQRFIGSSMMYTNNETNTNNQHNIKQCREIGMTEQYTGASGPRMQGQHIGTTQTTNHNPLPTFLWSSSMKFSSILRGLVLTAALLILGTEAYAQLPVRTQQLQLRGTTSGTLTQTTGATTTDYTVVWPSADFGYDGSGTDVSVVMGDMTAAGTVNLRWREVDNDLIDGIGVANEIAFFQDANTIISSPNFTIDAPNGTITVGAGAVDGVIRLVSSGAGTPFVSLVATSTTANTYNFPGYGTAGPFNVVGTQNVGVANQIIRMNSAGDPVWVDDPFYNAQRGLHNPADNVYTTTIAVTGTPDDTDLIMVTSVDITGNTGNILTVTAVAANSITVAASGPFTGTERISWLWIPIP